MSPPPSPVFERYANSRLPVTRAPLPCGALNTLGVPSLKSVQNLGRPLRTAASAAFFDVASQALQLGPSALLLLFQ
jgi:hypothetical protein